MERSKFYTAKKAYDDARYENGRQVRMAAKTHIEEAITQTAEVIVKQLVVLELDDMKMLALKFALQALVDEVENVTEETTKCPY